MDLKGQYISSAEYVSIPISYFTRSLEEGVTGKVFVQVDVTDDCSLINPRIIKGMGNVFDAAALSSVDFMQKFRAFVSEKTGKSCKNELKTFTYPVRLTLE
jgi:outer membrane biosynthesis protein TonB